MASGEATYTARITSTGGREGHVRSDDGVLDLDLRRPGGPERGANPEQLFAAAWTACFQSALMSVGRQRGIDATGSRIDTAVSLVRAGSAYSVAVEFRIAIPGVEKATGEALAEAAHQLCPYSNATRGNVDVQLIVID